MKLKLIDAIQKSESHYGGYVNLLELARVLEDYPFEDEVLQKTRVYKEYMENGMINFKVTVRFEPETDVSKDGDDWTFGFSHCELRDGKSRAAAMCMLSEDILQGMEIEAEFFLATKEKMDKLERNIV